MGKKKIVIDTNNLIAAIGWEGKSRELLRKVIAQEFELFISTKQIDELKRVMEYPKFKFTAQQKLEFLEIITNAAIVIDTKIIIDVCEDKDDNMIIECAVGANADYIISGDAHLRNLKTYRNIKITSVNEFLIIFCQS